MERGDEVDEREGHEREKTHSQPKIQTHCLARMNAGVRPAKGQAREDSREETEGHCGMGRWGVPG